MSKVLEETGCPVLSSDLYDRGYGEVGLDFLTSTRYADNIVTNPPFNCAEGFVAGGVKHMRGKFALLLRLAFLEGANRARTIFSECPPSRVWVFSERITFYPTGVTTTGTGTTPTVACSEWSRAAVDAALFALRAAQYGAPYAPCAVPDAVPCAVHVAPDVFVCRSAGLLSCWSAAAGPQHLMVLGLSVLPPNSTRPAPKTKRPFDARSFGSHSVQSRPILPIDCCNRGSRDHPSEVLTAPLHSASLLGS